MNESIIVVTGIIIDYNRANTTMQVIAKERSRTIFNRYAAAIVSVEKDTFQVTMKDPNDVIRMVLELRAMLKQLLHDQHPRGLDIRASIGLGDLDEGDLNKPKYSVAGVRSMSGLSDLTSRNGRLGVSTGNYENDALFGATLRLLDRVIACWSSSQAAAMEYALQGLTQHQIAEILQITQPSVNNRLKLAHWNEIEHLIEVWESFVYQKSRLEYSY
jgi:hypothetical protein